MTKRMLIDATRQEETRVVVLDGNKLEDFEFESENRKQIKGNIYIAKVMRVEPSLQAAFVDYGGNKHGFLAFSEIHPDYYNISKEIFAEVEKEVDEIIENKKQQLKERELRREQSRLQYEAEQKAKLEAQAKLEEEKQEEEVGNSSEAQEPAEIEQNIVSVPTEENDHKEEAQPKESRTKRGKRIRKQAKEEASKAQNNTIIEEKLNDIASSLDNALSRNEEPDQEDIADNYQEKIKENTQAETLIEEKSEEESTTKRKRIYRKKKTAKGNEAEENQKLKVLSEKAINDDPSVCENISNQEEDDDQLDSDDEDEDFDQNYDFELQKKLLRLRKLYYNSTIQDVIKEGQILLVQVVKEERGNKGAALTTYLSLAGKYCVLMPNRIKSGGVSRKITSATDRKRLKEIMKELPIASDMSMIIRTAGEEKTKQDIVRDYNYLIRTWNQIRLSALKTKAPALIYEEGNLIKRALRDMYTKDVSEVLIDGEKAYQTAREFVKIYAPNQMKKIKCSRHGDIPLFQRFQVENQLDKLHNPIAHLESGGYLVINPTEALVSIDVNSGKATKEKDIEETALKTNLEAADEIARQLRLRNLAGLVVIDFIDMEEAQNNHAVEKRMKEAMKNDRARVQIAKMSCFGLLEISRQRMHSSFLESNYVACPHCHGIGMIRSAESAGLFILREIEEEGIKNRFSKLNVSVPHETAFYLLNQKKKLLCELEEKYDMEIVICADDSVKNIADYKIERIKISKNKEENLTEQTENDNSSAEDIIYEDDTEENSQEEVYNEEKRHHDRRNRFGRNRNLRRRNREREEDKTSSPTEDTQPKRKTTWWKRLIGGE